MSSFGEEIRSRLQQFRIGVRKVDEESRTDANKKHNASLHISKYRLRELEENASDIRVAELAELAQLCRTTFADLLERYLTYFPELQTDSEIAFSTKLLATRPEDLEMPTVPKTKNTELIHTIPKNTPPSWQTVSRGLLGKIGSDDFTMWPMLPPGSIVRINARQKSIMPRASWKNDYDRPIYFLEIRNGFACGWCELCDRQLILTPHFLSPASSRSWTMGRDVEVRGRVVGYLVDHELTDLQTNSLFADKSIAS